MQEVITNKYKMNNDKMFSPESSNLLYIQASTYIKVQRYEGNNYWFQKRYDDVL